MLELSIPVRFAIMFVLLMLANKEYRWLDKHTLEEKSWTDILVKVFTMAVATFVAGVMLHTALIEILISLVEILHTSIG